MSDGSQHKCDGGAQRRRWAEGQEDQSVHVGSANPEHQTAGQQTERDHRNRDTPERWDCSTVMQWEKWVDCDTVMERWISKPYSYFHPIQVIAAFDCKCNSLQTYMVKSRFCLKADRNGCTTHGAWVLHLLLFCYFVNVTEDIMRLQYREVGTAWLCLGVFSQMKMQPCENWQRWRESPVCEIFTLSDKRYKFVLLSCRVIKNCCTPLRFFDSTKHKCCIFTITTKKLLGRE